MARSFDHNLGLIHTPQVPDDVYIIGAAVVVADEEGKYRTIFVPVTLDAVPHDDVQEGVGGMLADAFMIANLEEVSS